MKYVIIGNGVASIGAMDAIIKNDKSADITVFGDEPLACYGRPLISYFLEGKIRSTQINYRDYSFYQDNNIRLVLTTKVTEIDPVGKTVTIDSGRKYPYDKLLVATGSSPFIPPTPGYEKVVHKFTFMRYYDAVAIKRLVRKGGGARVLIVGAGLTGLKAAEGLYERAGSITVVDMASRVLPAVLDEECAPIMQRYLERKGIKFYLNDSVKEYSESSAELKSGAVIDFDVLITSVGVRPNVSLVEKAGGVCERMTESGRPFRGIVVDDNQKTTLDDIYAAGDCTLSYDVTIGNTRPIAIQPNAYMQGEMAGNAMSGGFTFKRNYLPVNAGGFLGLHIITAGSYIGSAIKFRDERSYRKFYIDDGKLKGFIMIGNYSRVGILTDMIRKETPIDDVDFRQLVEEPKLAALGMDYVKAVLNK